MFIFFFFKQKTAYEMRISDWSSDVCSSDLVLAGLQPQRVAAAEHAHLVGRQRARVVAFADRGPALEHIGERVVPFRQRVLPHRACVERDVEVQRIGGRLRDRPAHAAAAAVVDFRSEEHTSELQSLMRISYAVFCLKKKKT